MQPRNTQILCGRKAAGDLNSETMGSFFNFHQISYVPILF